MTLSEEIFELDTVKKMIVLYDNFERNSSIDELVTDEELREEREFINALLETTIIKWVPCERGDFMIFFEHFSIGKPWDFWSIKNFSRMIPRLTMISWRIYGLIFIRERRERTAHLQVSSMFLWPSWIRKKSLELTTGFILRMLKLPVTLIIRGGLDLSISIK